MGASLAPALVRPRPISRRGHTAATHPRPAASAGGSLAARASVGQALLQEKQRLGTAWARRRAVLPIPGSKPGPRCVMRRGRRPLVKLEELETVVLDGWMVWGAGNSDLAKLLPRLQDLDISNTLLSSWESIAQITRQLPSLRFLNISGNKLKLPNNPDELQESVCHITHLVLNNMKGYTWSDLMTCCVMFPTLRKLQIAFNKLCKLGPVPVGLFDSLEEIDIGVNPICSWEEVCHLGTIPSICPYSEQSKQSVVPWGYNLSRQSGCTISQKAVCAS
nr:tubulin-specific chaperone E-like [Penaeus vannamei]